jgi:hypothetical protein
MHDQVCCASAAEEARALCANAAASSVTAHRRSAWAQRRSALLQALGRSQGSWRPAAEESRKSGIQASGFAYDANTGSFRQRSGPLSPGPGGAGDSRIFSVCGGVRRKKKKKNLFGKR